MIRDFSKRQTPANWLVISYFLPVLCFLAQPTLASNLRATAWDVLYAGAASSNSVERAQAIAAAGTIGPTARALSLIEKTLADDKDPLVRQTAATTLGKMNARRAIPKLHEALRDDVPEVRLAAAQALWKLGDHSCRGVLMNVLSGQEKGSSSKAFVQKEMRVAKRDLHDPSALARIGITQGAEALLGPFGFGVGFAEDMFKDQGAVGRSVAASLLGSDSSPATLNALEEASLDSNAGVRAAAAQALGERSDPRALKFLEPLLNDRSAGPRLMAAAAIIRLTEKAK